MSSAQKPDGKTRADVDVVKGSVGASVQASVDDKGNMRLDARVEASLKFVDVNAEATLPEFCIKNRCYEATIGAESAIGTGVEGGIGYEKYKTKPGGTFTASFGSGLGVFFKGNVKIDRTSNKNDKGSKP